MCWTTWCLKCGRCSYSIIDCTVAQAKVLRFLMQQRDESRNNCCLMFSQRESPCEPESNLIGIDSAPSETLLATSLPWRRQAAALNFLLHNIFSSNQRGINQRHLIQSEWLWDNLFCCLRRGEDPSWSLEPELCKKHLAIHYLAMNLPHCSCCTHPSPVIKMAPRFSFQRSFCEIPNKCTVCFLLTPSTVFQTLEI